jgi:thioredoxin 1
MSLVVAVDASIFAREVEAQPGLVLVDFWAPWCAPCRVLAPVLEQLARERQGQLKVVKVNLDENLALAERFQVRGAPTLLLLQAGRLVDQMLGAPPKLRLEQWLARYA